LKITNRATIAIEERFYYYENMFSQAAAFFMASEEVNNSEFREYTRFIKFNQRFPGLTALGFAELVKAKNLDQFVLNVQKKVEPTYRIWPYNKDAHYFAPVKYIEPFTEEARPLLGFDMLSEPSRLNAMLDSASRGDLIVTNELHLHTMPKDQDVRGFNFYAPVYSSTEEPVSKEDKLSALQGFVVGIFHTEHLFNAIIKERDYFNKAINIQVFLKTNGDLDKIYDSQALIADEEVDNRVSFKSSTSFPIGNKELFLQFESLPVLEKLLSTKFEWYVLVPGLAFSFFVFIFLRRLAKAKFSLETSESNLKKSVYEKSLLVEEGKTLTQILDIDELLTELASFFPKNFSLDTVVYYSEEDNYDKRIVKQSDQAEINYTFTDNLKNKVLKTKENLNAVESSGKQSYSYMALPLNLTGKIRAIIILRDTKGIYKEQRHLTYINELAYLAAVCLENAFLFKELQKSNTLKDEFLATVSHELRTPLNVIYGHSQILMDEDLDPDIKEQIDAIYRSAKRQSIIIEDILDISSIVNKRIKFDPDPININESIWTAIQSIEIEAEKKKIDIDFDDSIDCSIMGVQTRLIQIFWNLLSNAVKFTPEQGQVKIKTSCLADTCEVTVSDTGQGIDKDFLPFVFERFRQEDQTTIRSKGGLGLGLAIVSDLVKLHNGSITVESEGKNKGTNFTLSFPMIRSELVKPLDIDQDEPPLDLNELKDLKILAVDDEVDSLRLIEIFLRPYNLDLVTAKSAKEALTELETNLPDILISDIGMPEMNGYELIKKIRTLDGKVREIPAIALTAYAQKEDRLKAEESGFNKFVSKPVKKADLIATIKEIIN
ncbi:MAG: CHASE domain-containing protein, partial [Bacteriovoracaceae bacterium]|nr:CHASE domain-containing protein [Bacteriovoracaceae bacterium]